MLFKSAGSAVVLWLSAATSVFSVEPVLWLDASQTQTVTLHDGRVKAWSHRGTTAFQVSQAEQQRQPKLGDKFNGHSTLTFDGSDFLEGQAVLASGDDSFTIIALWRPHRSAIQSVFEQAGPGRGGRAALLQVNNAYGFNGQSNDFHSAVQLAPQQWRLTAIVITDTKRDNVIVLDNQAPPVFGSIDLDVQNIGADRIQIGKKIFGGEYYQGDLAEIRVFDQALSQEELRGQLAGIKKQWGLRFESMVPEIPLGDRGQLTATNPIPTSEQVDFFENKVRPLLAQHCYECHSGKSKTLQGGLRLDGRTFALKGGDSGAAIVPGHPEKSLLIEAIRWQSYEMPPNGKLKDSEVATLVKWIEQQAPWPDDSPGQLAASEAEDYDWEQWRREHWAFQPVKQGDPPQVKEAAWIKTEIDRFVLSKLEAEGLKPAAPAEPRTLVRRIYFTLIGLPPTPQQVEEFLPAWQADPQTAIGRLVDQLLDTSQYGERWGRHWLDVARYSDGYGGFLDNQGFSDAWRYRDWVVRALNQDMPINEFLRQQIAGDLLGDEQAAVATGFFALGPTYRSDGGDPESVAQAKAETLSDRIDTLGRGLLGLTLACARCHDHKFDPIPQQDYYSLAGIFNNTSLQDLPLASQEVIDRYHTHQSAIKNLEQQVQGLQSQLKKEKREPTSQEEQQLKNWQAKLDELKSNAPSKYDVAHTLRDSGSSDMPVAVRGNLRKPGDPAPRRFLRILAGENRLRFQKGSGRVQLAEAVTDPANALPMRVFVNRVWLHHFGEALVRTPSNFGALGEKPTHPELLDWLTARFIESGYSLKSLHRLILSSSTWQMSSELDEKAFAVDGDNRLLWRMNPRRLDVEAWRDALLSVTGELDLQLGGPPIDNITNLRRTLYFKVSRNGDVFPTDEFLRRFDFPIMRATIDQRPTSIVPQQFLFLMNSTFMLDRAKVLAKRLSNAKETDRERIDLAYQLIYQRYPTEKEREIGLAFLRETPAQNPALLSWEQYTQVLLSANEFLYLR